MKDAYYFKHDANARHDPKIKSVFRKYGAEGYGWFWIIIENLREAENYRLEYNAFVLEALSEDMRCPLKKTQEFIDYLCCKELNILTKTKQDEKFPIYFYSMSLMRRMTHLDQVREKRVDAANIRWHGET